MTRNLFWIGLVAATLAAVWFVFISNPFSSEVRFDAQNPWIIGNEDYPFAYAGDVVNPVDGTAILRMNLKPVTGMVKVELQLDGTLLPWPNIGSSEHSVVLQLRLKQADKNVSDRPVHGDSGTGESRLPEIHARYAGSGVFEILIDGVRQATRWSGFWSIGDASRQSDGSIRNQGLVFSPLLRDRFGFTDPERLEFTLLLYNSSDSDNIILQLVFPDVQQIAG